MSNSESVLNKSTLIPLDLRLLLGYNHF